MHTACLGPPPGVLGSVRNEFEEESFEVRTETRSVMRVDMIVTISTREMKKVLDTFSDTIVRSPIVHPYDAVLTAHDVRCGASEAATTIS